MGIQTNSENIIIPKRDLSEPVFHQGEGGIKDRVHPGNDQFSQGDRIPRPPKQQGQGAGQGDASDSGEGEDEFTFSISKEEYLNLLQSTSDISYETSRALHAEHYPFHAFSDRCQGHLAPYF